jgi:hypothetical protein
MCNRLIIDGGSLPGVTPAAYPIGLPSVALGTIGSRGCTLPWLWMLRGDRGVVASWALPAERSKSIHAISTIEEIHRLGRLGGDLDSGCSRRSPTSSGGAFGTILSEERSIPGSSMRIDPIR